MSTVREYFQSDCKLMTLGINWDINFADGSTQSDLEVKLAYDFEVGAKYLVFFIPNVPDVARIAYFVIDHPNTALGKTNDKGDSGIEISMVGPYGDGSSSNLDLKFSGRVVLYVDGYIEEPVRTHLKNFARSKGINLIIRDKSYVKKKHDVPFAFISHDSRDKDNFVRPLAEEFRKFPAFPIWYDEYSLKVGDSLRSSIEGGLKKAQKCILVLSPHFLSNDGWGRAEFDSIFTRELLNRESVILPIWHGVSAKDVYDYSPRLADKVGIQSSLGVKEVAKTLYLQINQEL